MASRFLNGVAPRMMAPRERPLSREEFMELQERERRRRLMQERQERWQSVVSVLFLFYFGLC